MSEVANQRGTLSHSESLARINASVLQMSKSLLGDKSTTSEKKEDEENVNPLLAFSYANKHDVIMIIVAMLCACGVGILMPVMMKSMGGGLAGSMMIDENGNSASIDTMITRFCILGVCGLVLGFGYACLLELTAERQVARIKRFYAQSILRQEVGYFDCLDIGTLASDLEASCVKVRTGVGMKIADIGRHTTTLVGGYVVALTGDWAMALLMSVALPVIVVMMTMMAIVTGRRIKTAKEILVEAGGVAEEAFPAARTVAALGIQDKFITKYNGLIEKWFNTLISMVIIVACVIGCLFMMLFMSFSLGWWWVGKTLKEKLLEDVQVGIDYTGTAITTFFCVMISSFSIGAIPQAMNELVAAAKSMVSIKTIIDRESSIDPTSNEGYTPAQRLTGNIRFNDVGFAYPSRPERQIYKNVSFEIAAGETVALVGPSGCGKSTVIQLLQRFYDAGNGRISVDNMDVKELNLQWFRSNMAMVQQEPRLFCDTIKANIAHGKPNASDEEIINAAKLANAHNFICNLADGYNTNVGAGGSLLSGGQKQRIAIARAILRDPAILILDEATSALDNESEKIVQKALDDLLQLKKRTTIIIAHRLTTIRNANKIIVIDNKGDGSEVIEMGTHDELMLIENGLYKRLVESQTMHGPTTEAYQIAEVEQSAERDRAAMRRHSKKLSKKGSKASFIKSVSRRPEGESDSEDFTDDEVESTPVMRKLFANLFSRWKTFIPSIIGSTGAGVASPLQGLLMAGFMFNMMSVSGLLGTGVEVTPELVNSVADDLHGETMFLMKCFLVLAAAMGLSWACMIYFADKTGYRLVRELRTTGFANIIHQDMEFFDTPAHNVGFLSQVLSADCESVFVAAGQNFNVLYHSSVSVVMAIIMALCYQWDVALVAVACYSVMVPFFFIQARFVQATGIKLEGTDDTASPAFVMNEIVTNLKMIAAYGLQEHMSEHYSVVLQYYLNKGIRNAFITGMTTGVTDGIPMFCNVGSFKYAFHKMFSLDINDAVAAQNAGQSIMKALMIVGNAAGGLSNSARFTADTKRIRNAVENVFMVCERVPKIDARSSLGVTAPIVGNIKVDNVKFRYPGRPRVPVLKNVNFSIPAGKTIALVGESGSGKSTIVQFLERFYDIGASDNFVKQLNAIRAADEKMGMDPSLRVPDAGSMFAGGLIIDGHNIQDFNLSHLRSNIGMVGQEPVLFDVSVADNIRFGKLDASDEEIRRAAKLANAHEFITGLPEGYETRVGRGGSLLSGGQKQRVAIARALVSDPKILLLDEATSALDSESEKVVQKALDDLLEHSTRTTIVIAHRLSTIRNADIIVVFKPEVGVGSQIVEVGNHDELMQIEGGIYRNLVMIASH